MNFECGWAVRNDIQQDLGSKHLLNFDTVYVRDHFYIRAVGIKTDKGWGRHGLSQRIDHQTSRSESARVRARRNSKARTFVYARAGSCEFAKIGSKIAAT